MRSGASPLLPSILRCPETHFMLAPMSAMGRKRTVRFRPIADISDAKSVQRSRRIHIEVQSKSSVAEQTESLGFQRYAAGPTIFVKI